MQDKMSKKIEYYKHRLLDLGRRNRMINYRKSGASTLTLTEPSFEELYRRVVTAEGTLSFRRPIDRRTDPKVFSALALMRALGHELDVYVGDIGYEVEAENALRALRNLRAKAALALEEQGSNILYLSFGFLEWQDGKGVGRVSSPLLMVPVSLSNASPSAPYLLKKRDEDIVANPTLAYYFESNLGLTLPQFDESHDTLESYFEKIESFAEENGFLLRREASLGLLSFQKISMYRDIEKNEKRLRKNPIISALAGIEDPGLYSTLDANGEEANEEDDPFSTFQVLSADSSQQEAIRASKEGKSFVMQGPPGTGKSQTITNIIAEALAQGKKVLFVSEKMAALRVVQRRLEEVGLDDFCLPLHSYKANKRQILEAIGASLKLKRPTVKEDVLRSLESLTLEKKKLDGYVEALHTKVAPLGKSLYEVFGALSSLEEVPSLTYHEKEPLSISGSLLARRLSLLESYFDALSAIGTMPKDNPWRGLDERYTAYHEADAFKKALATLINGLTALKNALQQGGIVAEGEGDLSLGEWQSFCKKGKVYLEKSLPTLWQKDKAALDRALSLAISLLEGEKRLSSLQKRCDSLFYPEIQQFDHTAFEKTQLSLGADLYRIGVFSASGDTFEEKRRDLVARAPVLLTAVKEGEEAAKGFLAALYDLEKTTGMTVKKDESALAFAEELLLLLHENAAISKTWRFSQIGEVKALAAKGKAIAETVKEAKARILSLWHENVFTLDAEGLYLRFKEEYSGVKKLFSGQYYRDITTVRQYYRGSSRLDDDGVLQLLVSLRTVKEMEDYFATRLEEAYSLGPHFCGFETDWAQVEKDIAFFSSLWDLTGKEPCDALKALFARIDRSEALNSMTMALFAMRSSLQRLKEATTAFGTGREGDLATSLLPALTYAKELLAKLVQGKEALVPYLKDPALSEEELSEAFSLLSMKTREETLLTRQRATAQIVFGGLYTADGAALEALVDLLTVEKERSEMPFGEILFDPTKKEVLREALERAEAAFAMITNALAYLKKAFPGESFDKTTLTALKKRAVMMAKSFDDIHRYAAFAKMEARLREEGLSDFLEQYEKESPEGDVASLYAKAFYESFVKARESTEEALRTFHKSGHTASVKRFASLDKKQLTIARQRIRDKLIASIPDTHRSLRVHDEVSILQKELQKRRGIMPLRKLFASIPNLLMRLKPCLMMSPLSVSYFLEADNYLFDLLIFDEASQIFPEDAIGAICRGKQVIIVGDSKQLPPTDFFSSHANADDTVEEDDEEEDEPIRNESILEKAAEALDSHTLLWHYRSRHEHLIAFSNRQIYQNQLITFPSCQNGARDVGIEYVYVPDGVYEGHGKNCNVKEAHKCVELVKEHILRHKERSLGIIAFSEKQQRAIENAVDAFRLENPEYEFFFTENKEEPFFVKNLENVQGDERDTILFSIGYAKDAKGKMHMRFGPLGQEGGERRLNVAVTRAKENVKLVGSILPQDLDLARTSSEGVRLLRSYLDFAINGEVALPERRKETDAEADAFASRIARLLKKAGYTVKEQLGCSDFKLDIVVMHPTRRDEVLAAILLDGDVYHAANSTRDRDHLRSAVLKRMGWKLYRLWSVAFMKDPAAEERALLSFLESCLKEDGEEDIVTLPESLVTEQADREETPSASAEEAFPEEEKAPYGLAYYEEADWTRAPHTGRNDKNVILGERVYYLVSYEEPLHKDLLYRRLAPSFKVGKVTDSVKKAIDEVLERDLGNLIKEDAQGFLTLSQTKTIKARVPKKGAIPRPMEYIAKEEVAFAMLAILQVACGITPEDLSLETARVFGFERMGQKIKAKTEEALFSLMLSEKIRLSAGKVVLSAEK